MNHSHCSIRYIFYSFWLILSVLQASFTELSHDEAYYWMYSNHIAWGYFDHPPMIAIIIKLGWLLFKNELGVRLFAIVLNTASIFLIEKIIEPKNLTLFYFIISSIVIIHYGSFLAIPDTPLLFFTALFFLFYKIYVHKNNDGYLLILGLFAALMILSKYHAILILFFTILSNPKLLLKPYSWAALFLAIVILSPHILWQYVNGYPTIKYQLFSRSEFSFNITYSLEYLLTQPLIYGPIIGFILIYSIFKFKQTNQFEKTMQYNFIGVFVLFFIFTFKGKVEAHWTDSALIPLLFIGYMVIYQSEKLSRFITITFPISLFIILIARLLLMFDFNSERLPITNEFHGWKKWALEIKAIAGQRTVVFDNSYQNASKYSFYSQSESFSRTDQRGRTNQFDIWKSEENQRNKPSMIITNFISTGVETYQSKFPFNYYFTSSYSSYPEVVVLTNADKLKIKDDIVSCEIKFSSKEKFIIKDTVFLNALFVDENNYLQVINTNILVTNDLIGKDTALTFYSKKLVSKPDKLYFAISKNVIPPSVNSKAVTLIKE